MGTVRIVRHEQVAPGDVAFDRARSTYGRLVALTTREAVAHCFVYHRRLGTTEDEQARWLVAEMSARHGAVFSQRVGAPMAAVRVWRVPSERDRLLGYSQSVVDGRTGYDWPEIARIAIALASGRVLPRREAESDRTICVAHVLRAVLAARPDLADHLPAPGEVTWPGQVLELLTQRADVPVAPTLLLPRPATLAA